MVNSFRTEEVPEFGSCLDLVVGSYQADFRNTHLDVFGPTLEKVL